MIKYIDSNPPTLSGLYNLILHVSTSPLSNVDRDEVKMLLYGNYSGTDEIKRYTDLNVTFTEGENGVILVSLTLDATKHLFEEEQESGTYYIGLSATNSLDNESIIYEAENALSFDIRSEIAANVYLGDSTTPLVDDEIKNAYVIDVSGGEQTINIKTASLVAAVNEYENYVTCITKYYRFNGKAVERIADEPEEETAQKYRTEKNYHWKNFWQLVMTNIED
jgi:hypothetical protein